VRRRGTLLAVVLGMIYTNIRNRLAWTSLMTALCTSGCMRGTTDAVGAAAAAPPGSGGSGPGGASPSGKTLEIVRDERGVPHVHAATLEGAMFGLGYATAQDRLLQMELKRRVMRGRMAEAFGNDWVALDVQNRTMGWARHADKVVPALAASDRALLDAYAAGVNAYVKKLPGLPADFAKAHIDEFEPWTAQDCLLAWDYLANFFGGNNVKGEIENEIAAPPKPEPCPGTLDEDAAVVPNPMQASILGAEPHRKPPKFTASHSWVIAGWRNSAGKSAVLHANPQLPVMAPSYIYEYAVSTPELEVRGAGFAGSPGFLIFYNRDLAIGGSSAGGDVGDLFKLSPTADGKGYVVDGKTVPFATTQEVVKIQGATQVSFTARESDLGPVISDFHKGMAGTYAFRHVELYRKDTHTVIGAIRMMRAKNVVDYRAAISGWASPCIHTIYGDAQGNIAYQPACLVPERAKDQNPAPGTKPFDGSKSSQDWKGYLSVDTMPHVINPPSGYLFTANHLAVGNWYPHYLGMAGTGDTTRSQRLRAIFEQLLPNVQAQISPEQVRAIQDDAGSETVRIFYLALEQLAKIGFIKKPVAGPMGRSEKAWTVLDALRKWGGASATAAATYPGAQLKTMDPVFPVAESLSQLAPSKFRFDQSDPGYPIKCEYGVAQGGLAHWQKAFAKSPDALLGNVNDKVQVAVMNYHVDRAAEVYDAVIAKPSSKPGQPVTYHVPHQFNFMCVNAPNSCDWLSCFASNPGPCSLDPSATFTAQLTAPAINTIRSQASNAYSHWIDLGKPDDAMALTPPGTSEAPSSPGFKSVLSAWEQGKMFAAPLDIAQVKAKQTDVLTYR
jgi:penicillin amidase